MKLLNAIKLNLDDDDDDDDDDCLICVEWELGLLQLVHECE
jgi:hypothetical protein